MQNKDRLRKKYFFIRKKKYFDIKPSFFNPLIKLIKKRYKKKSINLSSYYPASFEVNILKLFDLNTMENIKIFLPIISGKNSMNFFSNWFVNPISGRRISACFFFIYIHSSDSCSDKCLDNSASNSLAKF